MTLEKGGIVYTQKGANLFKTNNKPQIYKYYTEDTCKLKSSQYYSWPNAPKQFEVQVLQIAWEHLSNCYMYKILDVHVLILSTYFVYTCIFLTLQYS